MAGSVRSSKSRYNEYLSRFRAGEAEEKQNRKDGKRELPMQRDWTAEPSSRGKRRAHRPAFMLLREFWKLLGRHHTTIALALCTITISTLLGLVLPLSTKIAFDFIITDHPGPTGLPPWAQVSDNRVVLLLALGAAMLAITLVATAVTMVGRYQTTRLTKLVQVDVRRQVFEHLQQLPLHRLHALKSGGVASIVRDDAGSIGEMLFSVIYNPWRATLTFIGGLVAMAVLDWRMLVGGILLVPAVYLSHKTWIGRIRPIHKEMKMVRTGADAHATEVFSGIRVVRSFGRRRAEAGRFASSTDLIARQEMLAWWWSRVVDVAWTVMIPGASALVIVYGGWQVLNGRLTIGDVAAFSTYLLFLLGPLETLVSTASSLQNNLAALDRCLDVLAEPAEFAATNLTAANHLPAGPLAISFKNVGFHYPNHTEQVLVDVSLEVKPGQTIALVGPSGSGKTTLCNLVARFFDTTSGRITAGGVDIRDVNLDEFRSSLGIVEQDVFLFDGTIGENIAYARREASHAEIIAAAQAANAAEFIARLERQYDTVIGERGVRLSGGQKQRIAIARAILAQPRILILDEATSNLDSESESLIQASLARLMKGRTCFVIAHRLGTVRNADRIVVLEKGRIIESGTHEELVASEGRYFEMLQVQLHSGREYAGAEAQAQAALSSPASPPAA